MTLDLGFSACFAPIPPHIATYDQLQFTLVDCPGHASLIRTIMGGARIIRQMLLVVDALKGIQTQTAECLVLGELTAERLVVVVNKIDQVGSACCCWRAFASFLIWISVHRLTVAFPAS